MAGRWALGGPEGQKRGWACIGFNRAWQGRDRPGGRPGCTNLDDLTASAIAEHVGPQNCGPSGLPGLLQLRMGERGERGDQDRVKGGGSRGSGVQGAPEALKGRMK